MSLTVDGVWKVGVWATTVWANGVWREGAYVPPVVTTEATGGYYSWPAPPRKKKRTESIKEEALELLAEKEIEAKQAALKAKQELRRAEAKDRQVVEQLRQIYAEQDALLKTVKIAKARIAALRKDDDEIAMILALAG